MAKKFNKKLLGMILSLTTLVLAALVVVMFFIPTFKSKENDQNYSACTICFVSAEKASEKASDAFTKGNTTEAIYWTTYSSLKDSDTFKGKMNFTAWMQFTAAVAALVVIVALVLAMFKLKTTLIAIIASIIMFGASLAAIISLGSLMGTAYVGVKFNEVFKFGAATIVGLISSILGAGAFITKKILKA